MTIRNGGAWNLNGFNAAVAGVTFGSTGGNNGGNGPTIFTGSGTLTLTGGITSTNLTDVREVPAILGLLSLPAVETLTVDPVSGAAVNGNGQIGLAINSRILSSGTITKAGAGVLSLGGVSNVANTVNFSGPGSGAIVLGASSNYPAMTIDTTNGVLDLRGQSNLQLGSVTGTGTIKNFNVATAGTLTVGAGNASFEFFGTLTSDYTTGVLNLTKIGSGQMGLTADNSGNILGTLTVSGGNVLLSSVTARTGFATYTLNPNGTLTLDNSTGALSNRLGGNVNATTAFSGTVRTLTMQGGSLVVNGNSGAAITENVNTLTVQNGGGVITLNAAGTAGVALNLAIATGNMLSAPNATGTLLIRGDGLGSAAGAGVATLGTVPAATFNVIAGQGTGANGATTMAIRSDILADASATGFGSGFLVRDSVSSNLRPLNQTTELLTAGLSGAAATNNVGISGATQNLLANVTANSLTFLGANAGIGNGWGTTGGNYGANGLLQVTLTAAGVLDIAAAASIGNTAIASGGTTQFWHVLAGNTLTLNSPIVGSTGGIIKADGGTLTFASPQFYTGSTVINGGTLQVAPGTGTNTLIMNPSGTVPTVSALAMNAPTGVFELNGNNQAIGAISSTNILPGQGGTIQNSGSLATLTTIGAASTFGGSINGALNVIKAGTGTLTLTGTSAYTGSTALMAGLTLTDGGQLTGTSGVTVNFSALTQTNSGLQAMTNRIPGGATLNGGTIVFNSRQGNDTFIVGALTPTIGANIITVNPINTSVNGTGSTHLTIASLGTPATSGTVNFTVGSGTLGAPLAGVTGSNPGNAGSNTQMILTAAPTLTNGIIGPWAIANGADFASYLAPGSAIATASGAAGIGGLGLAVNSVTAQQVNGSNVINVLSTAPYAVGEIVNGISGLTNPVITAINPANNTITVNGSSTATGSFTLTSNPYGAYSANALTAGVAADNITLAATVTTVSTRTINSLRITPAATPATIAITGNGLDQLVSIASGGLLSNNGGSAVNFQGGRYTAGTTAGSSLYVFSNSGTTALQTPILNNGGGLTNFVKSGAAQVNFGPSPILNITATASGSVNVTTTSTTGLTVGMAAPNVLGTGAGQVITSILSATQYTVGNPVGTGSTTAANGAFNLPTSQVFANQTVTTASNTVTLPAGSQVYPGMSVLGAGAVNLASGATASGTGTQIIPVASTTGLVIGQTVTGTNVPATSTITAINPGVSVTISNPITTSIAAATALTFANSTLIPAGTTVVSYVPGTGVATLSAAIPNGAILPLIIAPVAAQTAAAPVLTAGSNTFTVAPNTLGLNVGQVVTVTGGTGTLAANTFITAYNPTTGVVTLSAAALTGGTPTTANFAAPAAISQITATSSGSTQVTVPSSLGFFVGQPVQGAGIPQGTTVTGIADATHVTLSNAPTATGTANVYYGVAPVGLTAVANVPNTSTSITVANAAGIVPGMSVTGAGIPVGTVVGSVSGLTINLVNSTTGLAATTTAANTQNNLVFGAPIASYVPSQTLAGNTAGTTTISGLSSTAGLAVGMQVFGTGIPNGATVASIVNGTSITISAAAASTVAGNSLTFAAPLSTFSNGYTGSTTVNQGTLQIGGNGGPLGQIVIPGDLILNGGNATQSTANGSIASTSKVTINGAGTLTLTGNNTLSTIAFNGTGGTTTPTVTGAAGNVLVLTGTTNAITSVNDNLGTTPTISTLTLELNGADRTITTSGISVDDLVISAPIVNTMGGTTAAGLNKAGTGSLVLSSAASTFNGGVQLNTGTLIFAAASTQASGVVSSGPAGIGRLTIAAGTTLLADGTARNVSNAVTVNGDFTFGGGIAGNNLTLGGAINFGGTTRTVTVTNPAVASVLGGTLGGITATGTAGLMKAGAGVLALNSAGNNWSGPTTINGGVLQFGAAQVLAGSAFRVVAGAELNINAQNSVIGSLSGNTPTTGGLVTNSGAAATLTIGADGTDTSFGGAFTAATPANLNVAKIGAGTQTLTGGLSNATGTLTVRNGRVTLSGAGAVAFGTDTLNSTGTLSLDNSGAALANRLGGATKNVNIGGGTLTLGGNATGAVTEALGTMTIQSGGGTLSLFGTGGQGTALSLGTLAAQAAGGSLLLQGDGLDQTLGIGTARFSATTFTVITGQGTGGNGTATMPIRSDIIADNSATGIGTGFLTQDSVTFNLRPLVTAELAPVLVSSATTNFGNFAAVQNYNAATSANSLTISTASAITATGGGQAVQGSVFQGFTNAGILDGLTLTTGGIFANASAALNVGSLTTAANVPYVFHTVGAGTTLAVNGFLLGTTGGLTKSDAGTLNLDSPEYFTGALTVNAGTLLLNSGVANTILVTTTATISGVQNVAVNAGTLDLNGRSQAFGSISNNNTLGGTGGTITSATAANLTSSTGTATTFGGVIGGLLNFYKEGTATLTLTSANSFTGTTNILGGAVTLQDSGTLASTTLNLGGASLNLINNGLTNSNARVSSNALITMNGGAVALTGANYTASNVTLGATGAGVTLASGVNTFTVTPPAAATGNTAVLNIGNLTRTAGAAAIFAGTGLGSSVIGNAQEFVANLNGSAPTLTNGILGGWATAGATAATSDNWATLAPAQTLTALTTQGSTTVTLGSGNTSQMVVGQALSGVNFAPGTVIATITGPTTFTTSLAPLATGTASTTFGNSGIVPLNTSAYTNIAAYGTLVATTTAAANYSINTVTTTGTVTLATGGNIVNSLQINPGAAGLPTLDLGGGSLAVTSGGVMRTSLNTGASSITNGTLTAGTGTAPAELAFVVNNATAANVLTVSAAITDNTASGPVTVVKSGAGAAALTLSGVNTYTGGTIVNAGLVNLSTPAADGAATVAVPGNLTINNGGTVTLTAAGEIKAASNITINGGGVLNMSGTNTLASITFNGIAGTATPTVAAGTALTLSSATPITAVNDNLASTPTVSGTALLLGNTVGQTTINVSGLSPEGLAITAPITGVAAAGGINKTGPGSLILNAVNTFATAGGVTLTDGALILNDAAALGDVTNPLAIGDAVNANTVPLQVMSGAAATTLGANPVTVNRDFTFGGTASTNNLTIPGNVTLNGSHTITVTSPQVTGTISGPVSGAGSSLTKAGAGTLLLSGTGSYGGATTVAGGVLRAGAAGAIPSASPLTVNAGAVFDTNAQSNAIGSLSGNTPASGGMVTNSSTTTASTLTTGNDGTSTTFAGLITNNTAALNLTKVGTGTQTLSAVNNYTGVTLVSAGTLAVTGRLSGTTNAQVDSGGTLLLNNPGANAVNTGAAFVGNGGTLAVADATSGQTHTFASFSLNASSTVNFGAGNTANTLGFGTLTPATIVALTSGASSILTISNWTGSDYPFGSTTDSGNPNQSHFYIGTTSLFGTGIQLAGVNFLGFSPGIEVFNPAVGQYELVPVPEPTTAALLGTVALCAIIRGRARQRRRGSVLR